MGPDAGKDLVRRLLPVARRRAQGGTEKEQAFSEGGGASQRPGGLLRGFLRLLRRQRELLRSPGDFSEALEGPPLLISPSPAAHRNNEKRHQHHQGPSARGAGPGPPWWRGPPLSLEAFSIPGSGEAPFFFLREERRMAMKLLLQAPAWADKSCPLNKQRPRLLPVLTTAVWRSCSPPCPCPTTARCGSVSWALPRQRRTPPPRSSRCWNKRLVDCVSCRLVLRGRICVPA